MPTVAQKLCHEIVEPILASPSNDIAKSIHSRKSFQCVSGNTIRIPKPTKSKVIEKKKVISQLEPISKTVVNKFKSKERILRKDFTDTGVNTLISGPLRCDNNCVTNVRRRDNHCSCSKYQKRNNCKLSTKHVQTLNKSCSKSDKACTHSIDTSNCGTQFIENMNRLYTQISNRVLLNKSNEFAPQFHYRNIPQISSRYNKTTNLMEKKSNEFETRYSYRNTPQSSSRINKVMHPRGNVKRWALSNYPIRGPDF